MSTRRHFVTLLGGAAAWPLAARAQQAGKPTIGFMGSTTPTVAAQWVGSFVQRLRELGWLEGRSRRPIDHLRPRQQEPGLKLRPTKGERHMWSSCGWRKRRWRGRQSLRGRLGEAPLR